VCSPRSSSRRRDTDTMPQRISIGFQASPPLALRVSDEQLATLNDALGGEGWHEIEADDGSVRAQPRPRALGAHRARRAPGGLRPRLVGLTALRAPEGSRRHGRDEAAHAARRALSPRRPRAAGRPGALPRGCSTATTPPATTSRSSARRSCASCWAASARGSSSSPPSAATTARTSRSATAAS
jgi:hypothetical protein